MAVRVQLAFRLYQFGWTEDYYYLPGATAASAVTPPNPGSSGPSGKSPARNLAEARALLLGQNAVLWDIRSTIDFLHPWVRSPKAVKHDRAKGLPLDSGNLGASAGTVLVSGTSDIADTSLWCRAESPSEFRNSRRPLGGIPDKVVDTTTEDGFNLGRVQGYGAAFDAFVAMLTQGNVWGFKARVLPPDDHVREVVNLVEDSTVPGFLGVDVAGAGVTDYPRGRRVQLRGFGSPAIPLPNINGEYRVHRVVSPAAGPAGEVTTRIFLSRSANRDPLSVDQFGTIELVDFAVYPFTAFYPETATGRKRGVGYDPPRGRRRVSRRAV